MKKLFLATLFLTLFITLPGVTKAEGGIRIAFPLPPPIVFTAPPPVIALPGTYIYVVPDSDADIFFYDGWWWRLWQGRWYRSEYYDHGWGYYDRVPSFYFDVDLGWRRFYRDHNWHGQRWSYERIPQKRLHQNWRSWQDNHRWERQGSWGIQSYQPRPQQQKEKLRQQRQQSYQQRPAVRQHQKQRQRFYEDFNRKFE